MVHTSSTRTQVGPPAYTYRATARLGMLHAIRRRGIIIVAAVTVPVVVVGVAPVVDVPAVAVLALAMLVVAFLLFVALVVVTFIRRLLLSSRVDPMMCRTSLTELKDTTVLRRYFSSSTLDAAAEMLATV
eukprot:scaffold100750_cov72-Phaeocystis_antarctica.AAC.1